MKNWFSKEIVYLILGGIMLMVTISHCISSSAVISIAPGPATIKHQALLDSIMTEREEIKLERMEYWYCRMISDGNSSLDSAYLIRATEDFFHAKTIFPDRIEPRINLVRTYATLCYELGFFCYEAEREISYAYNYINAEDLQLKTEVDKFADLISEVDYEGQIEFITD